MTDNKRGLLLSAASCCAVTGAGSPRLCHRVKGSRTVHLIHCFTFRHANMFIQSLHGVDVYDHANKVIMDDNGRSLLCSRRVHALTRAHFAPSASPGNKDHSLSHWPRSVTGFFHSLPSLPLRSGGTRRLLWMLRLCKGTRSG